MNCNEVKSYFFPPHHDNVNVVGMFSLFLFWFCFLFRWLNELSFLRVQLSFLQGHLGPFTTWRNSTKNNLIGGGEAAGRSLAHNGPFIKGGPTGIYGESNVKARTKWWDPVKQCWRKFDAFRGQGMGSQVVGGAPVIYCRWNGIQHVPESAKE